MTTEKGHGNPESIVMILAQLASDDVLDTAYDWLCKRRIDYPPNADIWAFRRRWPREKDRWRRWGFSTSASWTMCWCLRPPAATRWRRDEIQEK